MKLITLFSNGVSCYFQYGLEQLHNAVCESNVEVPDEYILIVSCHDRCGTKKPADDLQFYPGRTWRKYHNCSCDQFCGFHGDCCQDFREFCPDDYDKYLESASAYPFAPGYDGFKCLSLNSALSDGDKINILMVDTCSNGSTCEFSNQLNEDVNGFVPMYDIHRGVHYISGHCAICNDARQVIPWSVTLGCMEDYNYDQYDNHENNDDVIINSTKEFTDLTQSTRCCMVLYSNPGDSRSCIPPPWYYSSTCPQTCGNDHLKNLCELGPKDVVVSNNLVYKNVHCALCNAGQLHENIGQTFTYDVALTLVFDFDPRKGLTVGKHPIPECSLSQVYVPDERICQCHPGFVPDGSDCIPGPVNITAIVTGTLSVEPTNQMVDAVFQEKMYLERNLLRDVVHIMDTFNVTRHHLKGTSELQVANDTVIVENIFECNCDFSSLGTKEEETEFKEIMEKLTRRTFVEFLVNRSIQLLSIQSSISVEFGDSSNLNISEIQCTWLLYGSDQIISGNGTMTVVSTTRNYTSGMYEVLDQTVIVCETNLDFLKEPNSNTNNLLNLTTLVCFCTSITCLIARIILHFVVTSFRNKPGRIQLQLTIALLLAFVMVLVGPSMVDIPDACITAAILMAYGFLAAFIWMNVIAVDTWLVFRPSSAFSHSDEEQRSLIVHYALGWGIPILLVLLSLGMNYSDVDVNFRPEFGGSRCWYTQRYAMLIHFGIPIATSILVNVCLYIITSINLHRAFKNATSVIRADGYHFGIYVRLFILMGITWIFGFISAFTDQIVVDFIFVILTSLQGLFLFISFVCNKRVLTEIRKKFKIETSSDKKTNSTRMASSESSSKAKTSDKSNQMTDFSHGTRL